MHLRDLQLIYDTLVYMYTCMYGMYVDIFNIIVYIFAKTYNIKMNLIINLYNCCFFFAIFINTLVWCVSVLLTV